MAHQDIIQKHFGDKWELVTPPDTNECTIEVLSEENCNNFRHNGDYLLEVYKIADINEDGKTCTFIGKFAEPVKETLKQYKLTEADVDIDRIYHAVAILNTCSEVIKSENMKPDMGINIGETKTNQCGKGIYLIKANESWYDKGHSYGGTQIFCEANENWGIIGYFDNIFNSYSIDVNFVDENNKTIKGIEWAIYNEDGTIAEDSSGRETPIYTDNTSVSRLLEGKYYIKILKVPNGYKIPEDQILIIPNDNYEEQYYVKIEIQKATYKIKVNCIDWKGNAVAGVICCLIDEDGEILIDDNGNPLYLWESGNETTEIKMELEPGKYGVRVLGIPDVIIQGTEWTAYIYEWPEDKFFTIPEDNNKTIDIVLEEHKGSIYVDMYLINSNEQYIKPIEETTFYIALFTDKARTQRVSDILEMKFINTDNQTATFTGLDATKAYYLSEVDKNGHPIDGGTIGNDGEYEVVLWEDYALPVDIGTILENNFTKTPSGWQISQ